MEAFTKEFYKNQFGCLIVKCCASCKHHLSDGRDKVRVCKKYGNEHPLDYLCSKGWEMRPELDNAGKGGGDVKKLAYFKYISENGIHHKDDFERQYGSKYLTK